MGSMDSGIGLAEGRIEVPVYVGEELMQGYQELAAAQRAYDFSNITANGFREDASRLLGLISATAVSEQGVIDARAVSASTSKAYVLRRLESEIFNSGPFSETRDTLRRAESTVEQNLRMMKRAPLTVRTLDAARPAIWRVFEKNRFDPETYEPFTEVSGKIGQFQLSLPDKTHFRMDTRIFDPERFKHWRNFFYIVKPVDTETGEPLVDITSGRVWGTKFEYPEAGSA